MTQLTNDTFRDAINSDQPVAVDFWAEWCMPCKIFAPVLEEISHEMDGKASFYKLNVDECGELAVEYGVSNIPTVILFQQGKEVERLVGVRPKEDVVAAVEKYL